MKYFYIVCATLFLIWFLIFAVNRSNNNMEETKRQNSAIGWDKGVPVKVIPIKESAGCQNLLGKQCEITFNSGNYKQTWQKAIIIDIAYGSLKFKVFDGKKYKAVMIIGNVVVEEN